MLQAAVNIDGNFLWLLEIPDSMTVSGKPKN